jgi:4-hydroxybenzoate polyprenyltransferase
MVAFPYNLKKIFSFYRIKDWRAYFLWGIFGFLLAKGFLHSFFEIFLYFLSGSLFLAFGFSVNDFFDKKENFNKGIGVLNNNKRNLFFSILPGIFGILICFLRDENLFLFSLLALFLGFFYSAPPLRFKSRPFLDLISHGLFAGSLIIIYPFFFFNEKFTFFHFLIALSFFYLSVMFEMRNHLEDYDSDFKAGVRTTACYLGYENSKKFLNTLSFLYPFFLFLPFIFLSKSFILFFIIWSLIFILLFFVKRNYVIIDTYYPIVPYFLLLLATF